MGSFAYVIKIHFRPPHYFPTYSVFQSITLSSPCPDLVLASDLAVKISSKMKRNAAQSFGDSIIRTRCFQLVMRLKPTNTNIQMS